MHSFRTHELILSQIMEEAVVKNFELVRLLGKGGMGSVYLARHKKDNKFFALKVASRELGEAGRARLEREAALLKRVQSKFLPGFFGVFEDEGRLVVVMEFVEGTSLQEYVDVLPSPAERLRLIKRVLPDLAEGISDLHNAGIVHRDLKPGNCVISKERSVVVDLGLANGPDVRTLTRTGLVVGTPDYLPPEQITSSEVGPKADLWQLGMIVCTMLLGFERQPGMDPVTQAMARVTQPAPRLHKRYPWIPEALGSWIESAMHPDPNARPDSRLHLEALKSVCQEIDPELGVGVSAVTTSWFLEDDSKASIYKDIEKNLDLQPSLGVLNGKPSSPKPKLSTNTKAKEALGTPEGQTPENSSSYWVVLAFFLGAGISIGIFSLSGFGGTSRYSELKKVTLDLSVGELSLSEAEIGSRMVTLDGVEASRNNFGKFSLELDESKDQTISIWLREDSEKLDLSLPLGWRNDPILSATSKGVLLAFQFPGSFQFESMRLIAGERIYRPKMKGTTSFEIESENLDDKISLVFHFEKHVQLTSGLDIVRILESTASKFLPEQLNEERWKLHKRASTGKASEADAIWGDASILSLRKGSRLIARLMGLRSLKESIRETYYQRIVPFAVAEWFGRTAPWGSYWSANHALGEFLEIKSTPFVVADKGPNNKDVFKFMTGIAKLGQDDIALEKIRGNKNRGSLQGRYDESGVFWLQVTDMPKRVPEKVELGLRLINTETWTAMSIQVGSRKLLVPLDDEATWRSLRIPPKWFYDAVDSDGRLALGFRGWEGISLLPPRKATLSVVLVSAVMNE